MNHCARKDLWAWNPRLPDRNTDPPGGMIRNFHFGRPDRQPYTPETLPSQPECPSCVTRGPSWHNLSARETFSPVRAHMQRPELPAPRHFSDTTPPLGPFFARESRPAECHREAESARGISPCRWRITKITQQSRPGDRNRCDADDVCRDIPTHLLLRADGLELEGE